MVVNCEAMMSGRWREIFFGGVLCAMMQGCSAPPPPSPPPPPNPPAPSPSANNNAPKVEPPPVAKVEPPPRVEPTNTKIDKSPEPAREIDSWEKVTEKDADEITYEDAMDDTNIVFPWYPDFERVGDDEDRKKSFEEWKGKLESWDCNREENVGQRVRNFISLMALVDVMQMEWEGETAPIIFERMKKEIPRDQLLKAATFVALKPEVGTVLDKCPDVGIDDGTNEERVRERVGVYAKKVVGRLLGKLPPKPPAEEEKK